MVDGGWPAGRSAGVTGAGPGRRLEMRRSPVASGVPRRSRWAKAGVATCFPRRRMGNRESTRIHANAGGWGPGRPLADPVRVHWCPFVVRLRPLASMRSPHGRRARCPRSQGAGWPQEGTRGARMQAPLRLLAAKADWSPVHSGGTPRTDLGLSALFAFLAVRLPLKKEGWSERVSGLLRRPGASASRARARAGAWRCGGPPPPALGAERISSRTSRAARPAFLPINHRCPLPIARRPPDGRLYCRPPAAPSGLRAWHA